jgi:hypothetical protein
MLSRFICLVLALILSSCSGVELGDPTPPEALSRREQLRERYGRLGGSEGEGFVLFSTRRESTAVAGADGLGGGGSIAVNPFLWRAALETIDFMPLNQTDPFGGVIITDWYAPPETPRERFKLNVYILDQALRADGVRVAVFRQVESDGSWLDAEVDSATAARIEDNILTRARELRVASLNAQS